MHSLQNFLRFAVTKYIKQDIDGGDWNGTIKAEVIAAQESKSIMCKSVESEWIKN